MLKKIYIILYSFFCKFLSSKTICFSYRAKRNLKTKLEGYNRICKNTDISDTSIGRGTYIGWNSIMKNGVIGRFCSIAPFVECIYGRHPLSPYVSTHPSFFSLQKQAGFTFVTSQKFDEFKLTDNKKSFTIGNDVWIGYGVKIIEGVSINNGAIVAAGSVVTKDIPCYEIWGGIPAKKIKDRFPNEIKEKLIDISWWDKEMSELKLKADNFNNVNNFIINEYL